MFKKFTSKEGTSYILSTNAGMLVDELITFLEQYRGLKFFMGAAENLAFVATDEGISCESYETLREWATEENEHLWEMMRDFFCYSDDEIGTEVEWRKLCDYENDDNED